jgi:DNA repair protein RecO
MPEALDSALILRRFAYGESSLVLHVLAREHGRVHMLAKGAYRPTARYYAALDLFDTLELGWQHAPARELQVLREATLRVRRHRLATDLACYEAALTVLELAGIGAPENAPAHELFDAATRALDALLAARAPVLVLIEFELALLHNLGLSPALERCAACGGEAPPVERGSDGEERAAFSAGAGGRLCPACAAEARAAGRRVGTLPTRVLALAYACGPGASERLAPEFDLQTLENTRDFVARFLEYHLEGRPVSYRRFLAVPNRNRPLP